MSRPNQAVRRTKPPAPDLAGVIAIDKPVGPSSMRAVSIVRRRAGGVRTGHAGTLDPLASGVLVLALGRATRHIARLMDTDKRYRTTIDLSAFTTTDDREGERTEVPVPHPPGEDDLRAALTTFVGRIHQRPPAFSAMKINGQRAYRAARAGRTVEIPAREVTIHALSLERYDWPHADITMHCEKGVYVRSLARDLGTALGVGGHCITLQRTAVGPFTLEHAVALDDVHDPLTVEHLLTLEEVDRLLAEHPSSGESNRGEQRDGGGFDAQDAVAE